MSSSSSGKRSAGDTEVTEREALSGKSEQSNPSSGELNSVVQLRAAIYMLVGASSNQTTGAVRLLTQPH